MKKGEFSVEKLLGLILGVAGAGVLILLAVTLLGGFNKGEETSKSYFETFMREVEKADNGDVGEFVMWQDAKDKRKRDVFLIYFDDKFMAEVSEMVFVRSGSKNGVCVCYWDGETGECPLDSCASLEYPIENDWAADKEGQWFVGNKDEITIERDGDKYLASMAKGRQAADEESLTWSQVAVGDILRGPNNFVWDVMSVGFKDGFYEIKLSREGVSIFDGPFYFRGTDSLSSKGYSFVDTVSSTSPIIEEIPDVKWGEIKAFDILIDDLKNRWEVSNLEVLDSGDIWFTLDPMAGGTSVDITVSPEELLSVKWYKRLE